MERSDFGNISCKVHVHVTEILGGFPGIIRSHTTDVVWLVQC